MKQGRKTVLAAVLAIGLLSSCTQATASDTAADTALTALNAEELFSERDLSGDYDKNEAVSITLSGTTAASTDSSKVSISGADITIQGEGVYLLTGTLTDGQIIIDAPKSDKVQVVLNGVTIQKDTSAAIYVRQADKTFLTLAEGTTNTLSNKSEFVSIDENTIDGVIFAKDDITFNGSGALTLHAAYGSGIVGKDELTITGGTYTITAAEHGFDVNDSIAIADGTFQVTAGKDGFHSENSEDTTKGYLYAGNGSYTVTAAGDGLSASSLLQIEEGTFQVTTGGGSEATLAEERSSTENTKIESDSSEDTTTESVSAKGIKAAGNLLLRGGTFTMDCADDAFHSNTNLTVENGAYTIATGDDGFHADLAATVEGGTINITKSYEGIEGQTVLISAGDINIVAADDGLNAAEGGEDTDFMAGERQPGNRGEGFTPEEGFNLEENFSGEPPAEGERPAFDEGTMPADGERPTMENAPQERPEGEAAEAPAQRTGEGRGQMGGGFQANENCKITITGGTIALDTKGDSIDSNGSIAISGGTIYITGPENSQDSCIDSDGEAVITGGTLIACGSSSMFRGFGTASTQGWALFYLTESKSGGVTVKSESASLLTYEPTRAYSAVLVSHAGLQDGSTYTITTGEETQSFTMEGTSHTSGTGMGSGGRGQMKGERQEKAS